MKSSLLLDVDCFPVELSDMELVSLTRLGDKEAFGHLWQRHYHAAIRAARSISFNHEPEDLAQEAFTRIYQSIQQGKGPKEVFRAYLYTVLRSVSMNWQRNDNYEYSLDDITAAQEPAYAFEGQVVSGTITARAFATLKSEWRAVLWYMDVEEMKPKEVAPLMGLSPNATSALAVRAREGLRVAWLQAHINSDNAEEKCKWAVSRLGSYNRASLPSRDKNKLEDHLITCLKCSILVEEVDQVSRNLGIFFLPALLGPQAFTYLDTIHAGNFTTGTIPPSPIAAQFASATKLTLGILASAVTTTGLIVAGIFIMSPRPVDSAVDISNPIPFAVSQHSASPSVTAASTSSPTPEKSQAAAPEVATPLPNAGKMQAAIAAIPEEPRIDVPLQTESRPIVEPSAPVNTSPSTTATPKPTPLPKPSAPPTPAPTPKPTAPPSSPGESIPPAVPTSLAPPVIVSVTAQGLFLPLLQGSGFPGAKVTVISAGQQVGWAIVNDEGTWSVVPELTLSANEPVSFSTYQELDGMVSKISAASAPITLATPQVDSIQYTNAIGNVTFSGPVGSTVEVFVNGQSTGNLHTMEGTTVVRRLPSLSAGAHTLVLRFIDPDSGMFGAGITLSFVAA